ncbi:PLP-dependent aminotransferase family protein [Roseospira goensis]|uniref:DNA-binding transcriptional MocR family regulator n=1 Tax=Roseospira goensis TaxID=391922 RepID=A0A7W6RYY2_9PROT|nr:PLP-dependent aminotransferase family protein [Roseospira goensis]MBB4285626.1 DNA-binding transcriptional MocR family regulator [Roseospira goensis]
MTDSSWRPPVLAPDRPVYRAIAEALAADIAAGRLAVGARLPTHRALAESLGVTVTTVTRAYAEAARRGLVDGTVGRGTFVRAAAAPDSDPVSESEPETATGEIALRIPPPPAGGVDAARRPVDLGPNLPAPVGAEALLAETLATLGADPAGLAPFLGYQPDLGAPSHRAAGAAWIARAGLPEDPASVAVTAGVQHGIACALMTLVRPGEPLLCGAVTYPGLRLLADRHGARLIGVALDEDGLVPEALDEAARRHGARAVFCVPTLQNPTGVVVSARRREALAAVAARRGLTVIEDDVYGLLPARRPPPIAALIPERTVFLTGTAKALAPGLRVGFARVPPGLRASFGATLRATMWMAPALMVEVAARWIADGRAETLLAAQRRAVAARQAIAADTLAGLGWHGPEGAIHLWVRLPAPWRAEALRDALAERGVLVLPAATFHVGEQAPPEAVRLCLGAEPDPERLRGALALVREVIETGPAATTTGP